MSGKLFCGHERQKFLSYDAKALKHGEYFKVGQLLAMALVHCGIGPWCLSPILFDSLVKGPGEVVVLINSVYDPELQLGLQRLMSTQSVNGANEVIAEEQLQGILELSGTLRFMKSLCDVRDVASETAHWYVLCRTRAAFVGFKSGLNCLGLLDALLHNPDLSRQTFFFHPQVLCSDIFENLLTISRSEELSNRWQLENIILAFCGDLLLDVEEKESGITFSDILFFVSGLKFVPSRWICLELEFLHDAEANGQQSNFPKSNTCSCVLYLTVTHSKYVDFKKALTFAIRNSKGFGPIRCKSCYKLLFRLDQLKTINTQGLFKHCTVTYFFRKILKFRKILYNSTLFYNGISRDHLISSSYRNIYTLAASLKRYVAKNEITNKKVFISLKIAFL